jgi:drug/metabolite transporter (DMT)-like permease
MSNFLLPPIVMLLSGAFFANVLLGEVLTPWGIGGATLITIAAATNAFLDLGDKSEESSS